MKERLCCPDIKLLATGMCPYYLPREFSSAIVYIPPSAGAAARCEVIHASVAKLQQKHPEAFCAVLTTLGYVRLDSQRTK